MNPVKITCLLWYLRDTKSLIRGFLKEMPIFPANLASEEVSYCFFFGLRNGRLREGRRLFAITGGVAHLEMRMKDGESGYRLVSVGCGHKLSVLGCLRSLEGAGSSLEGHTSLWATKRVPCAEPILVLYIFLEKKGEFCGVNDPFFPVLFISIRCWVFLIVL